MDENSITTLEKAQFDKHYIIQKFRKNNRLNIDKLYNIGITEKADVIPLFGSVFNGTRAYLIKGCVIALRNKDASKILVKLK